MCVSECKHKMIVTLNFWVPKIMASGRENMQQSEMPKFAFAKNFSRVYFFQRIYEIYSPSKSKGLKGGNYICFVKMGIASKRSRLKHGHPSLLYALRSVPSPAKIRGKTWLSDLFIFHLLSC